MKEKLFKTIPDKNSEEYREHRRNVRKSSNRQKKLKKQYYKKLYAKKPDYKLIDSIKNTQTEVIPQIQLILAKVYDDKETFFVVSTSKTSAQDTLREFVKQGYKTLLISVVNFKTIEQSKEVLKMIVDINKDNNYKPFYALKKKYVILEKVTDETRQVINYYKLSRVKPPMISSSQSTQ